MRILIAAFLIFFSAVSPAMSCKTPDKPSIEFARAAQTRKDCIKVYLSFPETLEMLEALAPRLIIKSEDGINITVDLYTRPSNYKKGEQLAYACLSEKALLKAKILIQYMNSNPETSPWDCMQTVELEHLDKLLAESDAKKK